MDTTIFSIIILILSVVVHEISHGYAALFLGDSTAKNAGRLTLNPIKHLDPIGSVFLPLLLSILPGSLIFGWAKPVPYNPYNLRNRRWGELIVAIAGPISNIVIAFIFGMVIRLGLAPNEAFLNLSFIIVVINIVLAIFNLIPVPPLDGSKILFSILPQKYDHIKVVLERSGFLLLLIVIFFLWNLFTPLISWLINVFTGLSF
jgi:Zn-dependent protease